MQLAAMPTEKPPTRASSRNFDLPGPGPTFPTAVGSAQLQKAQAQCAAWGGPLGGPMRARAWVPQIFPSGRPAGRIADQVRTGGEP